MGGPWGSVNGDILLHVIVLPLSVAVFLIFLSSLFPLSLSLRQSLHKEKNNSYNKIELKVSHSRRVNRKVFIFLKITLKKKNAFYHLGFVTLIEI